MKLLSIVLLVLFSFFAKAVPVPPAEDLQSELSKLAKNAGLQLLRNDVREPHELHEREVGKFLICYSRDFTRATLYLVTEKTFPVYESTVRVLCVDGNFYFGRGYL